MNYRKEHIIYTLMWIMLYLSPVMGLYMRMSTDPHLDFSWMEVFNVWKFYTVWLVLFVIHNFLLAPILILKRRTCLYTVLITLLLTVSAVTLYALRPAPGSIHRQFMNRERTEAYKARHDGRSRRPPHKKPVLAPMHIFGPGEMVAFIGGLLMMGMNIGVKLYFKSQDDSKILVQIERQNLERQLEYLKYQVNPHFFMNTLNNIHALVDINPERAKTSIVELSKMMRYILYEGNNKLTPLPREVQFLQNYVRLMGMRYTERVKISLNVPNNIPDMTLPPLLLIIFVENAFKHGISYRTESFIDISISTEGGRLRFECRNSRPQQPADNSKKGGMGLHNVKRRLDLLFAGDYTLDIREGKDTYDVLLDIPLANPAQKQTASSHNKKETI